MATGLLAKSFRRTVPPLAGALAGILLIAGVGITGQWLRREAADRRIALQRINKAREQLLSAQGNAVTLKDLREADVARFKAGLTGLVQSKRSLYEAGISLQEEKRLLEKQDEIMSTYLVVDEELRRVLIMKGDQVLKSCPLTDAPPRAFGGVDKPLPNILRIISKERFAHPERGKSEMVNGKLEWTPPQVGTSVRANALGEYVMFTQGGLILHGPPRDAKEHRAFPHYCLELPLSTARDLYRYSFIGTKILLATVNQEAAPPVKNR